MKKYILSVLLIFGSIIGFAQTRVDLAEVGKHAGDSVVVEGKVYSTRYFADSKNAPTLLNMGAAFPNQLLTVVIYREQRKAFFDTPEDYYKGKTIRVTGRVELYKNKPQIVTTTPLQIVVPAEEKK